MNEEDTYCDNCLTNLSDPKNAGFLFDETWYCSGHCAEVAAGFLTRGNDVADYNEQLAR